MKTDYLNAVEQRLKKNSIEKQILAELDSHLSDKIEYYAELGYSEEEAEKRSVEEMGEPDDTALPLRELYDAASNKVFTIISLLFFAAAVIVPIFFHKFYYASDYYQAVYHLITIDFASAAVIVGFALILIYSFKTKNKGVTFAAAMALLLSNLTGMVIFRPAVFAVVKIIKSGFGGYFDSIFAYTYFTEDYRVPLITGSYIVFAVLLIWAVVQWVVIFRQERMRRTKTLNKVIRIGKAAVSFILGLNLIIMTLGTVIALFELPEKREIISRERKEMIDMIVYSPMSELSSAALLAQGYHLYGMTPQPENEDKIFSATPGYISQSGFYGLVGNNSFICSDGAVAYTRTDFDLPVDALGDYIVDSDLLYNNEHDNLQEFIDEGWYDKAFMVYKYHSYGKDFISFSFNMSDYKTGIITFEIPDDDYGNHRESTLRETYELYNIKGGNTNEDK